MMRHYIFITITFLLLLSGCAKQPEALMHQVTCSPGQLYAMERAECIDTVTLLEAIDPYRIIFLGDRHNSPEAHDFAVALIDRLAERGYRVHLANEWFTPADNPLLASYVAGEINDGNFTEKIGWSEKAGYDFELFAPIYHAVREHGGTLYGINLTREERRLISDANVTGMSEALKAFYDNLDLNVSAHRQLMEPYLHHCKHRENCPERIYRVQVAWDTKMAQESVALAETVLRNDKDRLIVFVGSMHLAHRLGITMRFARSSNTPFTTLLPDVMRSQGYRNGLTDYIYIYTPVTKQHLPDG